MGFFGISSTLIDAHTLPGKLALACRRVGLRNGWMGGWVGGGMSGYKGGVLV